MVPAVVEWWRLCLSRELSARGDFRGSCFSPLRRSLHSTSPRIRIFPGGLNVQENFELSNRRNNILGAACLWLGVLVLSLALPPAFPALRTLSLTGTVTA